MGVGAGFLEEVGPELRLQGGRGGWQKGSWVGDRGPPGGGRYIVTGGHLGVVSQKLALQVQRGGWGQWGRKG